MIDKVVRGVLTIGLVGVAAYLVIVGSEVPEWLAALAGGALCQYVPAPGTIGRYSP